MLSFPIFSIYRHVAVGWGVVEDTLKTEVERRKENVGKRVTKVKLLLKEFSIKSKLSGSEPSNNPPCAGPA